MKSCCVRGLRNQTDWVPFALFIWAGICGGATSAASDRRGGGAGRAHHLRGGDHNLTSSSAFGGLFEHNERDDFDAEAYMAADDEGERDDVMAMDRLGPMMLESNMRGFMSHGAAGDNFGSSSSSSSSSSHNKVKSIEWCSVLAYNLRNIDEFYLRDGDVAELFGGGVHWKEVLVGLKVRSLVLFVSC